MFDDEEDDLTYLETASDTVDDEEDYGATRDYLAFDVIVDDEEEEEDDDSESYK